MIEPESIFAAGTIVTDTYPGAALLGSPRPLRLLAPIIGTARISAIVVPPVAAEIGLDAWIYREATLDAWITDPGDVDPPVEPVLDDVLLLEDGDSLVFEDGDDWELEEAV